MKNHLYMKNHDKQIDRKMIQVKLWFYLTFYQKHQVQILLSGCDSYKLWTFNFPPGSTEPLSRAHKNPRILLGPAEGCTQNWAEVATQAQPGAMTKHLVGDVLIQSKNIWKITENEWHMFRKIHPTNFDTVLLDLEWILELFQTCFFFF